MTKPKRDSNSADDMMAFVDRKRGDKPIELKTAAKSKPKAAAKPKKK